MSTHYKIASRLALITFLCWCCFFMMQVEIVTQVLLFVCVNLTVATVIFLIVAFIKKRLPDVSAYRIFTIVDGVVGTGILAYGIYDILTDTEWFAGLLGTLLLIFVVPVTVLMLVGNLIMYRMNNY